MLLLVLMTLLGSSGGVFLKKFGASRRLILLMTGGTLYGAGALLNVYLLGRLPYSLVVPANSLTFVWTLGFARWIFGERITWVRTAGVFIIMSGLAILAL